MLEQFEAVGTINFIMVDNEAPYDVYAVVTANVEFEAATSDCPASCTYKLHPDFTVYYEGCGGEIPQSHLKDYEFEIYTYVSRGTVPMWKTVKYSNVNDLINKEMLSIEWD